MNRFYRSTQAVILAVLLVLSAVAGSARADTPLPCASCHPVQTTGPGAIYCTTCQSFQPITPAVASMIITGPLDSYLGECWGCADPWSGNHSLRGLLTSTDASRNPSVAVNTASPTFQVHVEFDSNGSSPGAGDQPYPGVYAIRRGDAANFDVTLERCLVPPPGSPPAASPDCTDYAGGQGNWQDAGSNAVAIGLPSANQAGREQLQVSDPTPFGLGRPPALQTDQTKPQDLGTPPDLARTYRVKLHAYLQQTPGMGPTELGNNTIAEDTQYTAPFDVALAPVAVYQGKVLPYTILYQPPGDMSAPSFTLGNAYGTQFTAGGSTNVSGSMTEEQNHSVQAAARIGLDLQISAPLGVQFGGGFDVGSTQYWDHSTQWGQGTSADTAATWGASEATNIAWEHPADVYLVPGAGQMCQVTRPPGATRPDQYQYTCSPPEEPSYQIANEPNPFEPFWQDEFILTVHPQFAVWTVNGQTQHIMTGSAAFVTAPVYQLNDCAAGVQKSPSPCHLTFADPGVAIQNGLQQQAKDASVDLTPQEAAGLLGLDPFYAAGSQSAALAAGRAVPVQSLGGYGLSYEDDQHDGTPGGYKLQHSYSQGTGGTSAKSTEYDMTVTDTVGSSEFAGFDFNMAGTGVKYTVTDGESTGSVNQIKMIYTDSTAVTATTTYTSGSDINDEDNVYQSQQGADCPKNCHDPLVSKPAVEVYLDRTFGTLMFQDPDAPCNPRVCGIIAKTTGASAGVLSSSLSSQSTGTTGTRVVTATSNSSVAATAAQTTGAIAPAPQPVAATATATNTSSTVKSGVQAAAVTALAPQPAATGTPTATTAKPPLQLTASQTAAGDRLSWALASGVTGVQFFEVERESNGAFAAVSGHLDAATTTFTLQANTTSPRTYRVCLTTAGGRVCSGPAQAGVTTAPASQTPQPAKP